MIWIVILVFFLSRRRQEDREEDQDQELAKGRVRPTGARAGVLVRAMLGVASPAGSGEVDPDKIRGAACRITILIDQDDAHVILFGSGTFVEVF
ncbi:MAG: hypothetical protein QOG27_1283 [Verrucomicrobiota bacterium]|jgi:hypothetical protein